MPSARRVGAMVASLFFLVLGSVDAAVISPGTPTTTVPSSLFDPLASLSSPLPPNQFLLPIAISGANGLQDWSFDLLFDASVVNPADDGGLYQSVYQAEFNATDPTLSNITSSGFFLTSLDGIAGFSSGVSGDGLLAFILFEFLPNQQDNDPAFSVANATTQQAPEPETLALMICGMLLLGAARRRGRSAI